MLAKSFLEAASGHLIDKVALVFERLFLLGELHRLDLLLVPLQVLHVQRFHLLNLLEGLGLIGDLGLSLLALPVDLLENGLVSLELFLGLPLSGFLVDFLLLFDFLHVLLESLLAPLILALLPLQLFILQSLDEFYVVVAAHDFTDLGRPPLSAQHQSLGF